MPPLLLDDDEAVAVAIGLRTATGGAVTGIEETSLRALAKLEQVLPPRLRRQVRHAPGRDRPGPARSAGTDRRPEVAGELARLAREHCDAALRLRRPEGRRVAAAGRAVPDRQRRPALVPRRVGPGPRRLADVPGRPDAAGDVARAAVHAARRSPTRRSQALVARGVPPEARRHQARVVVHAPADRLIGAVRPWVGTIDADRRDVVHPRRPAPSASRTWRSTSACSTRTSRSPSRRSSSTSCGCWPRATPPPRRASRPCPSRCTRPMSVRTPRWASPSLLSSSSRRGRPPGAFAANHPAWQPWWSHSAAHACGVPPAGRMLLRGRIDSDGGVVEHVC